MKSYTRTKILRDLLARIELKCNAEWWQSCEGKKLLCLVFPCLPWVSLASSQIMTKREIHWQEMCLRNKCGRRGVGQGNPRVRWEYRLHRGHSPRCSVLSPYSEFCPQPTPDFHICSNSNCFRVFSVVWDEKMLWKPRSIARIYMTFLDVQSGF